MDQDATWYGDRPPPRPHCVKLGPSSLKKRHISPLQFSAHAYCRQTVPHLSNCWALVQSDYTDGEFLIMLHTVIIKNGARHFGTQGKTVWHLVRTVFRTLWHDCRTVRTHQTSAEVSRVGSVRNSWLSLFTTKHLCLSGLYRHYRNIVLLLLLFHCHKTKQNKTNNHVPQCTISA